MITGLRMLDVRRQIAKAGGGLAIVTKYDAGYYTARTHDGRTWAISLTRSGKWRGEESNSAPHEAGR